MITKLFTGILILLFMSIPGLYSQEYNSGKASSILNGIMKDQKITAKAKINPDMVSNAVLNELGTSLLFRNSDHPKKFDISKAVPGYRGTSFSKSFRITLADKYLSAITGNGLQNGE